MNQIEAPPTWKPSKFLVAQGDSAMEMSGWTHCGVAMRLTVRGSPKGRRPPRFSLYHLNSGHSICRIMAHVSSAFAIGAEIAACGDWGFYGLDGWRNSDPELPARVGAILKRYPGRFEFRGGEGSREAAAIISAARV